MDKKKAFWIALAVIAGMIIAQPIWRPAVRMAWAAYEYMYPPLTPLQRELQEMWDHPERFRNG